MAGLSASRRARRPPIWVQTAGRGDEQEAERSHAPEQISLGNRLLKGAPPGDEGDAGRQRRLLPGAHVIHLDRPVASRPFSDRG